MFFLLEVLIFNTAIVIKKRKNTQKTKIFSLFDDAIAFDWRNVVWSLKDVLFAILCFLWIFVRFLFNDRFLFDCRFFFDCKFLFDCMLLWSDDENRFFIDVYQDVKCRLFVFVSTQCRREFVEKDIIELSKRMLLNYLNKYSRMTNSKSLCEINIENWVWH